MEIVKRLRQFGPEWSKKFGGHIIPYEVCVDAADEIERLRAIEDRARLVLAEWPRAGRVSEPMADQLQALRELLQSQQKLTDADPNSMTIGETR